MTKFREAEYKQSQEEFDKAVSQPGRKCRNCSGELEPKTEIFMCRLCINKIMG